MQQQPTSTPKPPTQQRAPTQRITFAPAKEEKVTPSTLLPIEQRGRWFKFFFSPKTYHVTRTVGSIFIFTYFLGYSDLGKGTVVEDLRIWGRKKLDSFMSVSEEDRQRMTNQQLQRNREHGEK